MASQATPHVASFFEYRVSQVIEPLKKKYVINYPFKN